MTGTGTCVFCGQNKIVQFADNLTDEDMDKLATQECSCEGASLERKVQHIAETARKAIKMIVEPKYEETAQAMEILADPMARDMIQSFQVVEGDNVKVFMKRVKSGIEVKTTELVTTTVGDAIE